MIKSPSLQYVNCLLFVIIGLTAFYYSIDESGTSKPKEDLITNSTYAGSVVQVERYLKDEYLKDPDSYEGISWSAVVKLSETTEIGFASYQVRHKFRAKNGYGGYNVEEMLFKLDYQGNIVEMKNWFVALFLN